MTTKKQLSVVSDPSSVQQIPVERLVVSPEETRKIIDQVALAEMAKSIGASGVIEALLVRPVALDCMSGDPLPAKDGKPPIVDGYEIVSGQRRWLASKLVGKATCPCIVREMTDDEARVRRTVSNLQRQDLAPMEQAEAFGKLLAAPGATVESVAAAVGKSPSYVGRRVKLLDAIEFVRQALAAGAIEVGHALELARLEGGKQAEFLEYLDCGYSIPDPDEHHEEEDIDSYDRDECRICGNTDEDLAVEGVYTWADDSHTLCTDPDCVAEVNRNAGKQVWIPTRISVADLKREINRKTFIVLAEAPFELSDELPPMACSECPKRTVNAAYLFEDVVKDSCIDPACYEEKVKLWINHELRAAETAGHPLVMISDGYTGTKGIEARYDVRVIAEDGCEHQEAAIWVSGPRAGHRLNICRDAKCKTHWAAKREDTARSPKSASTTVDPEANAKFKAERKALLASVKEEQQYRVRLMQRVMGAVTGRVDDARLLREICAGYLMHESSQYKPQFAAALELDPKLLEWNGSKQLAAHLDKLTDSRAILLALLASRAHLLVVHEYECEGKRKQNQLDTLAESLGINLDQVRKSGSESASWQVSKPEAGKGKQSAAMRAPEGRPQSAAKAPAPASKAKPAKKAAKKGGAK